MIVTLYEESGRGKWVIKDVKSFSYLDDVGSYVVNTIRYGYLSIEAWKYPQYEITDGGDFD